MKVVNEKLFELEVVINRYSSLRSAKVAWMLARNKSLISGPIKDVRELTKATEAMNEFDKAKEKLAAGHARKDKDTGQPVWFPVPENPRARQYDIADQSKFEKALVALKKEHPEADEDRDANEEKFQELLGEDVEISFYRLPMSKMPLAYKDDSDEDGEYPIAMGDLAMLFELGIVYDDEPSLDEEPETAKGGSGEKPGPKGVPGSDELPAKGRKRRKARKS